MGWLSTLGKLVGKGALAVGTGGASLAMPGVGAGSMIGDVAGAATGGAANAMANNRGTSAALQLDQNRDLENQLIAREQEKRSARNDAYKNAIRGSIAYNYDPSKAFAGAPAGMPHFDITGGTMGNPQAHAAGDELVKQSMNRLTQPDLQVNGGAAMPAYRNLWTDPEFRKTLNPGTWEKILGGISVAAPIAGAVMGMPRQGGQGGGMGNTDPGVL